MTLLKTTFSFLIVAALTISSACLHATTTETSKIITKVINAYGGDRLTNAKSLKIIDHNKGPWLGESENPGLPEIWRINEELTIDFENKRKSLLSYRVPRTTIDLEKWIFDGEQGFNYDILHKKYSLQDWVTYHNLGGSVVRSIDTMHAKRLHSDLKESTYLGEEFFRGKVHQKLAVTLTTGEKFTYFIDGETGLIRKVLRSHPQFDLVYVFSNYQKNDGLTYASDMNFFVDGELRLTSVFKGIELNPELKHAFAKFEDFKPWGETLDNSSMMSKQIGKGIYQAGKGRSKTIFIEEADHFIAIGSASELPANFEEVKKLTKVDKPLGFFVVSHHHRGNLRGLSNVLALGAKLVTAGAHQTTVAEAITEVTNEQSFVVVPDRQPFKLGSITIHDIPTAHSQHYLLVHSPENKMVISDEHYETQLKTAKPRIFKDMVIFGNALQSLNIGVESLIDIQSWRTIGIKEFTQWITDFEAKRCPTGYEICAKG